MKTLEELNFYPGACFDSYAFTALKRMPQESQDYCRAVFEGLVPIIADGFDQYPGDFSVGELAIAIAYGAVLHRDASSVLTF